MSERKTILETSSPGDEGYRSRPGNSDQSEREKQLADALGSQDAIIALHALREAMRESAAMFGGANRDKQRAVEDAIGALGVFVLGQFGSEEAAPLVELAQGFRDLRQGTRHPLLEPHTAEGVGNRAPDGDARKRTKAYSAAAVEWLHQSGDDVGSACRKVATKLAAVGIRLAGGKHLSANTVKRWREQARSGSDGLFSQATSHLARANDESGVLRAIAAVAKRESTT